MSFASYAIWGGALAVLFVLLFGLWVVGVVGRFRSAPPPADNDSEAAVFSIGDDPASHPVVVSLMNQKTDAMLASLARSIEQERRKLADVVEKASPDESVEAGREAAPPPSDSASSPYGQIAPMIDQGMDVPSIARSLQVSEAEVALALRVRAA